MAPIPKRKTERAPPVDKLIKPAIGIGVALLAYQFFTGLDTEIPRIDPTDELGLRDVLFGEGSTTSKNYVVLCHKEDDTHLSSVFQDAQNDGSAPAEFRLLDCDYILPTSEKSIADRFKLNLKQRPTVFVSGQVGPPKQIPSKHLKTGKMLVKLLRNMLEPRAQKIETTQDLRTKCLNKDVCGLLLKGSKTVSGSVKTAMANLVSQHPKVAFASVDTSVLFVRNLEEYLPEYKAGVHRFVVFQKISGDALDSKADRLVTSIAPLPAGSIGFAPMNTLVQSVVDGNTTPTKIPALPVIKTRTKKLEEEERAKRQRKEQRTAASETKFEANDGSREGRKLEREKRRAEHRAEHNVREKTPEEIKEMERQRRIRMEEEAEKWNMAPEDAPEEGEYMEEYEEGDYQIVQEDDEEEDDEEVMDLD